MAAKNISSMRLPSISYLRANPERVLLVGILLVFGCIFSLISLVNHYLFRTTALDLGMFNQALYSFAHFKQNYFTLAPNGVNVNYLGDHFSPITFLYVPFYYIFGTYTLLIIQIAAVLAGGYGVYKLARSQLDSKYLPLLVILQFFLIWGIYSALAFDFHNNVVGAMLVPWLVYFYIKEKKLLATVFFALILIAKENMAIWLVFIVLALIFRGGIKSWRRYLRFEIPLIICALIYFSIVIGFLMPALASSRMPESAQMLRYANLGSSPAGIAAHIVTHPVETLKSFLDFRPGGGFYVGRKAEVHTLVLISGGVSFLLAPYYLIALIPIYLQKFLANDPIYWGVYLQYSIEFVPIISLAFIDFLMKIQRRRRRYATLAAPVVLSFMLLTYGGLFYAVASNRIHAPTSVTANFLSKNHYQSKHNISEINRALGLIPGNAILSASSTLAPHLSFRDNIYLFPNVKDAQYIAILDDPDNYYPLDAAGFAAQRKKYLSSPDFKVLFNNNDLIIFKRRNAAAAANEAPAG